MGWRCSLVSIVHLPTIPKVLGSIPSIAQKKKKLRQHIELKHRQIGKQIKLYVQRGLQST